jgi:hypothetical protein
MPQAIAASTIAQQAFRYMEASPLSSFGDDSAEANAARQQYPIILAQALRRADWSFASRLFSLPEAAAEVVDEALAYSYQLPSEILALRDVRPQLTAWRVDGRLLRADEPGPLTVRATVLVAKETDLPGEFQDYVSLLLGAALSPQFASSANRAAILRDAAESRGREVLRADRAQASTLRWDGRAHESDWVSSVAL